MCSLPNKCSRCPGWARTWSELSSWCLEQWGDVASSVQYICGICTGVGLTNDTWGEVELSLSRVCWGDGFQMNLKVFSMPLLVQQKMQMQMLLWFGIQEHYSKSQCERCFPWVPLGCKQHHGQFFHIHPVLLLKVCGTCPLNQRDRGEEQGEQHCVLCQPAAVTFLFTACRYIYIYLFLNFFSTFVEGMKQQITNNNRKINTRLCFFCEIWNMASICQTELQRVWVSAGAQTNRPATLLIDKRLRSAPVSPVLLPPKGTERTWTFQASYRAMNVFTCTVHVRLH